MQAHTLTAALPAPAPVASVQETLEVILEHVRRLLDVSGCAFLIVDWDAQHIRPAASWFASDAVREALSPVLDRAWDAERPGLTEAAIGSNAPLLIAGIETWPGAERLHVRLVEQLGADAAAVAWEWYRTSGLIACPMRTTAGRLLGVLAIALPDHRSLSSADDLRTVDALAGLAALAVERSELLDREARRAHEELLLNTAAQEMAATLEPAEVCAAIVRHAACLTGAPKVMLTRFDPAMQQLRTVAQIGFSERVEQTTFDAGEGMIGRVVRTRRPYVSRAHDADRFLRWVLEEENICSFAHVPLLLGPRLFGVLSLGDQRPDGVDGDSLRRVEALARLAAGALANALDFQHERRIARALARGFVPETPPRLDGLEIGVTYEPAGEAGGGGDFFGIWELRSGAVAVLIGDVSGKGLEVSAQSAMTRFFIEARSWDSECPAEVLFQVNQLLCARTRGAALVTAFMAVLTGDTLRYANAGHVPPLLVSPGGGARELTAPGLPLGIEPDGRCEPARATFVVGDLLFAATDGLIESRRDDEQFGEARVRDVLAELASTSDPQALVDEIHHRVTDWATRVQDDIIILALRR